MAAASKVEGFQSSGVKVTFVDEGGCLFCRMHLHAAAFAHENGHCLDVRSCCVADTTSVGWDESHVGYEVSDRLVGNLRSGWLQALDQIFGYRSPTSSVDPLALVVRRLGKVSWEDCGTSELVQEGRIVEAEGLVKGRLHMVHSAAERFGSRSRSDMIDMRPDSAEFEGSWSRRQSGVGEVVRECSGNQRVAGSTVGWLEVAGIEGVVGYIETHSPELDSHL